MLLLNFDFLLFKRPEIYIKIMAAKTGGHSLINPSINLCIHVSNFCRVRTRVRAPCRNGHCNKLFSLRKLVLVHNTQVVAAEQHKPQERVRIAPEACDILQVAYTQHRDEDLQQNLHLYLLKLELLRK